MHESECPTRYIGINRRESVAADVMRFLYAGDKFPERIFHRRVFLAIFLREQYGAIRFIRYIIARTILNTRQTWY